MWNRGDVAFGNVGLLRSRALLWQSFGRMWINHSCYPIFRILLFFLRFSSKYRSLSFILFFIFFFSESWVVPCSVLLLSIFLRCSISIVLYFASLCFVKYPFFWIVNHFLILIFPNKKFSWKKLFLPQRYLNCFFFVFFFCSFWICLLPLLWIILII